jgi:hypothetical protein
VRDSRSDDDCLQTTQAPTFYINNMKYEGNAEVDELRAALMAARKTATAVA